MKVASLFSGCGGLDLGFKEAGFDIVFSNDNDKVVWETYERNHNSTIDKRSILDIKSAEIPESDGIIGGPPCQSWSLAGRMRGKKDERGMLFYEYIRIISDKQPLFFVAENVPGIISKPHFSEFEQLITKLEDIGYLVNFKIIDSRNYGVPQGRKRVFIVGYHKRLGKKFEFPIEKYSQCGGINIHGIETQKWITLKETIGDLPQSSPAGEKNKTNGELSVPNHEHMNGGFSSIYMSRNRIKCWNEQSFTIQAGGRNAPLHPDSAKMVKVKKDVWKFSGKKQFHRRLSIRECARIQTFPDDFIFYYNSVAYGYKMIGNAVPVRLAEALAQKIKDDLEEIIQQNQS